MNHVFPARVLVEVTTRCNLACPSCVKHTQGWDLPEAHMAPEVFAALRPVIAQCQSLVLSGIGEPLLHPLLVEWVAQAKAWNPRVRVGFQSNGMLLTQKLARELVAAGLDQVAFSVDARENALLGALRPGATVEGIAQAFVHMRSAARSLGRQVRLGAELVLSQSNLALVADVVDWCGQQGVDFVILSHLIPYRKEDAAQSLHTVISQRALDFARTALAAFVDQGLNVRRLDQAYYHPFPGPKERQLVAAVRSMLAAAQKAGVEIPLGRVVRALEPEAVAQRSEVLRAFEQVQQVAARYGMAVDLPATVMQEPGACPFVATPTLAVAQDGALSPCHFVWHGAVVYPEGQAVAVKRRILGRLPADDPVAVWNSPQARRFREQAQGSFARCFDCNVVPCNFVDGSLEPFVADCYGAEVPCGVCPWVGGGFACLG
ncbi:MAG: radical SAM protein [Desulfomicrobiaceae bacterium]